MSDALNVGQKLVAFCREGKNMEAIDALYGDNIVSVEAAAMQEGMDRETKGLQAVRGKSEWWVNNNEVHAAEVRGPFPHGNNRFATLFNYDVTNKQSGQRTQMEEVGVYTVENNKIVREEFFFQSGE